MIKYEVVTKIRSIPGNLALGTFYKVKPNNFDEAENVTGELMMSGIRSPVFYVGEILIIDSESWREMSYPGRTTTKWDVEAESFDRVEDALARAREVMDHV